ncbi:hypothetical protein [Alkalinema sp. FACHB-956]|nr:hypothetical protein [Alkalinema sp. FACHB-956]MBD2329662.1 hypothetical protein [Alkalinema sp. FACHB-956]
MESLIRKTCAVVCMAGLAMITYSLSPFIIPAMGTLFAIYEVTYAS